LYALRLLARYANISAVSYRVAIDIGGTFTDLVLEDARTGTSRGLKVLSTPGHLHDGVTAALRATGVRAADVDLFVHGTTAGLNALLERRGVRVALVATSGFGDSYVIGRGHRPEMYDLRYHKPLAPLQRNDIFEVAGRLGPDGSELVPLDEAAVTEIGKLIRDGGYGAVAVCLIHAYANPAHELRVAELLGEQLDVPVVTSHAIAPVWREYERTSTGVISAYITPIMKDYLAQLEAALREEGLSVPVYITESNGGVMGSTIAADKAALTLLSGPVGGVVGTRAAGEALAIANLISADVGGTSFDVSLVRHGELELQSEFELQGQPILTPAVMVHTIGAGGGSIIHEAFGALRVGPQSAGASPGPACYGNGGTDPTITDANLLLGRIPSSQRLAGSMPLDVDAAGTALESVGRRFGLDAEGLAEQALEVVHFSMAEAIRELTVERGLDPADFALCAFGGAGGLHATDLAEELGVTTVVIPAIPGAFSAWGMLKGDIRHDAVQTFFHDLASLDGELPAAVRDLQARVRGLLELDGVAAEAISFEVTADLRYVGQEYTLTVPVTREEVDSVENGRATIAERFHAAYQLRYGHASPHLPIETVALRLAGIAEIERVGATDAAADGSDGAVPSTAPLRERGTTVQAAVYRRDTLTGPIEGPAIVLEDTGTTVIGSQWTARPAAAGHLLLERR
jgi:N-methylhydantoinase A